MPIGLEQWRAQIGVLEAQTYRYLSRAVRKAARGGRGGQPRCGVSGRRMRCWMGVVVCVTLLGLAISCSLLLLRAGDIEKNPGPLPPAHFIVKSLMTISEKKSTWTGVQKILIANRGECSCRVIRTCKKLGVESVAIYAQDDSHSLHVREASESKCVNSYLNQDEIIQAAKDTGADSIHPGYGFLAESPTFARKCTTAGLVWLGPSPQTMESFSSKTAARSIAASVGVPCVQGSPVLLNEDDAIQWASKIGYPVLLKPCSGGGGIGMQVCKNDEDIKATFSKTRAMTNRFFADSSVFVEKYVCKGKHIEVQVFGDGEGTVVHLGERECSIQRRYQKLIEETPSPALTPELREKICGLAIKLCAHVKYESAGTVEFIFDDETKEFFFLEVNTRLQVEHGVTEMVAKNGLDLVEWMIRQGHASTKVDLKKFKWVPIGSAIELRVYAEDPIKDFQPSPGTLGEFILPLEEKGSRFETWAFRGCNVTPSYDPLIVKIIQWGPTRSEALLRLKRTLSKTSIKGPSNNLLFLQQLIDSPAFVKGHTYTTTLESFQFQPSCFEVLKSGMNLTIQDYPGRIRRGLWRVGVPPSGPFDHLASRLANSLVGNSEEEATLEITVNGPTLKFHTDTVVAVAGAPFKITLNGVRAPQFASVQVRSGDIFAVEHLSSEQGVRCYIAVRGSIDVPQYLWSRSTFVKGGFGGYQGRELRAGDVIPIGAQPCGEQFTLQSLDRSLWPLYTNEWVIGVLPGPMANPDYMTDEDIKMLHATKWEVHHNSNRLGIRLIGPAPKWTRMDGGEGGSHPSNIHDCVYAIGTINFTGDMPIIIAHDGPSLGGFVCPITCVSSEIWKLGQVKAGDTIQFRLMNLEEAITTKITQNHMIDRLSIPDYKSEIHPMIVPVKGFDTRVVLVDEASDGIHPGMQVRLAGDSYVLVEYGPMTLDIRLRIRIHFLEQQLLREDIIGLEETAPGVRSLQIRYDPLVLPLPDLIDLILAMDESIADISTYSIRTRVFYLPLAWNHSGVQEALNLYMRSVRPEGPYLPSNIDFIAENNGVTVEEVYEKVHRASYMCLGLGDVYLGACCAVPTDPRDRLVNPKFNPARTYTQEGTVGLGGAYMCIYPMSSPGGYQLVGRTLPIWNTWGTNSDVFSQERPWLLEMFDQIRFYHVEEEELEKLRESFRNGTFTPKIKDEIFDVGKYSQFLHSIHDEVIHYQEQQREAAQVQNEAERQSQLKLKALLEVEDITCDDAESQIVPAGSVGVEAVITAKVWDIKVHVGKNVSKGDTVVVLEAMKTELDVEAPANGKITNILVRLGSMVNMGSLLVVIQTELSLVGELKREE